MRIRRFVEEERAQDLVEYALLGLSVATLTLLAMGPLRTSMRDAVQKWNDDTSKCWDMPAPESENRCPGP